MIDGTNADFFVIKFNFMPRKSCSGPKHLDEIGPNLLSNWDIMFLNVSSLLWDVSLSSTCQKIAR